MARFNQEKFSDATDRPKAWSKILAAAKKFDIEVSDTTMPTRSADGGTEPDSEQVKTDAMRLAEEASVALAEAWRCLIPVLKSAYEGHRLVGRQVLVGLRKQVIALRA
jgi:hypothetical protein